MRQIFTPEIKRFLAKAPEDPTELQMALIAEAQGRPEALLQAGWTSLSAYVRAMERDIADGKRDAPKAAAVQDPAGEALQRRREQRAAIQIMKFEAGQVFDDYADRRAIV